MRFALLGRSVVCIVAGAPNASVDLGEFEAELGLERPMSQISTPPVILADYQRLRVLAQGGQVQVEFKPNAGKDLIRRGAREILRQVRLHASPAAGFNVVYRVDADEGDDVLGPVIRKDVLAERLEANTVRAGLKASWNIGDSLDTLSIDPDQADEGAWLAQLNRHYARDPDKEATDRAVGWLAAADDEMDAMLRRVLRATGNDE